jgi:hypothetical protein
MVNRREDALAALSDTGSFDVGVEDAFLLQVV